MFDKNHLNPTCAFTEQIVSCLYGEATVQEKAAFDAHLNNCSTCGNELESFDFVRSSIVEWKKEVFVNLETPLIKLPYPIVVSAENHSWLDELRKLFTFSPRLSIVLAALAVCVGMTFLMLNFSNRDDIATIDNKPIESSLTPNVDKKVEQQIESVAEEDTFKKQTSKDELLKPSYTKTMPPIAPENRIVKASNNSSKSNSVLQNSNKLGQVRKTKFDKNALAVQKRPVLKLNNLEDEEDSSLRLADLFAEVESK
ncbi:MAG: hypothetical protein M3Q33_01830 [Acidobacteriota bacterium]|nr:hypothetical protein [Acidobacteriota bacterium]